MKYLHLLFSLYGKGLAYLVFFVTSRCDLNCSHCFNFQRNSATEPSLELNTNEIELLAKKIKNLGALCITGGEPLLRNDIVEITGKFYTYSKTRFFSLHSNGTMPDKLEKTVKAILENYSDIKLLVCISLDGPKEIHDKLREKQGTFDSAIQSLEKIITMKNDYENLDVLINITYCKSNQYDLNELIKFIKNDLKCEYRISLIRGNINDQSEDDIDIENYFKVSNTFDPVKNYNFLSFFNIKRIIDKSLHRLKLNHIKYRSRKCACPSGKKSAVIFENGDLHPCEPRNEKIGNLRESNFNIWTLLNSRANQEILRSIKNKECTCTWENILPISFLFSSKLIIKAFKESIAGLLKND